MGFGHVQMRSVCALLLLFSVAVFLNDEGSWSWLRSWPATSMETAREGVLEAKQSNKSSTGVWEEVGFAHIFTSAGRPQDLLPLIFFIPGTCMEVLGAFM